MGGRFEYFFILRNINFFNFVLFEQSSSDTNICMGEHAQQKSERALNVRFVHSGKLLKIKFIKTEDPLYKKRMT